MAHILVVDDEKDLVWTVTQGLRFQGYAVSAAYDGQNALRQVETQPPNLILLDIVMPGMDGVEVCHRLRMNPRQGRIPVIFLTARFELQNKITAFAAGADDYICKPFDMRELIARVQAVLRRSYADAGAQVHEAEPELHRLEVGSLHLDLDAAAAQTDAGCAQLTPNEFDLLKFLMQHPGHLFSTKQLLEDVWKYPPGTGDPALVRWHISNVRLKIEPDPLQPIYLHTVPRHGYKLVPPPPPPPPPPPRPRAPPGGGGGGGGGGGELKKYLLRFPATATSSHRPPRLLPHRYSRKTHVRHTQPFPHDLHFHAMLFSKALASIAPCDFPLSYLFRRRRKMAVEKTIASTSLAEVIDRILDKGIVIDAWVRVSLVGIELLAIEARIVVAGVDTFLKYAEAVGLTASAAAPA